MSNATTPAADAPGAPGAPGASEEQAREYLAALRSAPAEQVVTEILFGLLNAAQAKLGRRDGRLMIDMSATVLEHCRRFVSPDLVKQVDQALGQLRMGQVRAESAPAEVRKDEPNDLAEVPTPPAAGTAQPGQPAQPAQPAAAPPPAASPASRLWIPGRDF